LKGRILKSSTKLTPFIDEETGYWTFVTDEDFVILQLTDTHLTADPTRRDDESLVAIKTMVERVNADFVIITGDVANGKSNNVTKGIPDQTAMVADLMNSLNVYWTVSLGNHDQPNDTIKEQLVGVYGKYLPWCLFQVGSRDIFGIGNTIINLKNSKGKIFESLVFVDSNNGHSGGGYDNIHQDQIDWYEQAITKLSELNGEMMSSLLFIHIPLEEYKIARKLYEDNGNKDTDEVQLLEGDIGEKVSSSKYPDQMFETILKLNSTRAVFCGHDHYNNYGIRYKGIDLNYAMSIDYNAYAGCCTKQRGGTIIRVHQDGSYTRKNSKLDPNG
jgi:3',5'-cyclic AMP phosphodiesterase CpdA